VVSFTPRPFCSRGKRLRYPLDRRLDGPQSLYERVDKGEGNNKVVPALFLTEHHAMKAYWEIGI